MLERLPPPFTRRPAVLGLLLLCSLAAYANSFGNSFHYDDSHSIVDNPHVRSLANIPRFFSDPGTFSAMPDTRMYRPLLLVTYAVNYALGGYEVFGYHLVNFLLHLANALLVWEVARRLVPGSGGPLFAALLFVVHPVLSEPVNYISSRSSLLATAMYLAAFAALMTAATRPRQWRWHTLITLLFLGGLLSKSMAITFPAVGAAYLLWVRRGERLPLPKPASPRGAGSSPERLPPSAAQPWAASLLAGPILVSLAYVAVTRAIIGKALLEPGRSLVSQYATQAKAVPFYLATVAAPVRLSVEPQFSTAPGPADVTVLAAGAFGLSLAAVVLLGMWRSRVDAFGVLWFFVALAPSALVPLNVLVNEHRLYLPMAGAAVALAQLWTQRRWPRWIQAAGLVVLVTLTVQRNRVWRSEEMLWSDAVATGPAMSRSHLNLGKAYLEQERYEEAIAASRRALEIEPRLARAHYNIGTAYLSQRQYERAMASYERALEINPRLMEAVNNLGNAYKEQGLYDEAIGLYRRALALADHGAIYHNLGSAFLAAGAGDSAAAYFARALERDPQNRTAHEGLARAYLRGDQLERAAAVLERAAARWPGKESLVQLLGDTQAALGRDAEALARYRQAGLSETGARLRLGSQVRVRGDWARARRQYEAALRVDADNAQLHNALGEALHAAGQVQEALAAYRRAAGLDPDLAEAYANIGLVFVQNGRPTEAAAALGRAVHLDGSQHLTWSLLGRVRAEQGQRAAAAAAYERAIELAPESADHWYDLAVLQHEAGAAAQAERSYRAALGRKADMARARYGLGVTLVEQGRHADGAAAIERALEQGYDRPEAHINLATARLNLGRGHAAVAAYETFLERYEPDDSLRRRVEDQVRLLHHRLDGDGQRLDGDGEHLEGDGEHLEGDGEREEGESRP